MSYLTNKFDEFTISYEQPITADNYYKVAIRIEYAGETPVRFNQNHISLVTAELLTSTKLEDVKQGITLYEQSVLFWLSQITKKEYHLADN